MGHLGIQWLLHDRRTACLHIAMQSDLQILGQQHNRQVRSPRCLYSQHIVYRPCHRCSHPAHANLDPPRPQDAHRSQIDGHCVLVLWRRCHHRRRSTHERLSQGLRHWRSRTRSDIRSGLHPFNIESGLAIIGTCGPTIKHLFGLCIPALRAPDESSNRGYTYPPPNGSHDPVRSRRYTKGSRLHDTFNEIDETSKSGRGFPGENDGVELTHVDDGQSGGDVCTATSISSLQGLWRGELMTRSKTRIVHTSMILTHLIRCCE